MPSHRASGTASPLNSGSSSLVDSTYWWYRARSELLGSALQSFLPENPQVLDVGSADGPSVNWMSHAGRRVKLDIDPRGLTPGTSICGSALDLPFAASKFDVVTAFDVLEHLQPEDRGLREWNRVLKPGGLLLLSVPAYQWAWSDHDVRAGHIRRYTRSRLVSSVTVAGFEVLRVTYAFASVFPMFAVGRLGRRIAPARDDPGTRLPQVSPAMERALLALCHAEASVIAKHDLVFGSSVVLACRRPPNGEDETRGENSTMR